MSPRLGDAADFQPGLCLWVIGNRHINKCAGHAAGAVDLPRRLPCETVAVSALGLAGTCSTIASRAGTGSRLRRALCAFPRPVPAVHYQPTSLVRCNRMVAALPGGHVPYLLGGTHRSGSLGEAFKSGQRGITRRRVKPDATRARFHKRDEVLAHPGIHGAGAHGVTQSDLLLRDQLHQVRGGGRPDSRFKCHSSAFCCWGEISPVASDAILSVGANEMGHSRDCIWGVLAAAVATNGSGIDRCRSEFEDCCSDGRRLWTYSTVPRNCSRSLRRALNTGPRTEGPARSGAGAGRELGKDNPVAIDARCSPPRWPSRLLWAVHLWRRVWVSCVTLPKDG